jgi:predicted ATPase
VFLRGEPGVGKTRLALEFAASKGRVFLTTPRPGDSAVPFSTAARGIRNVLDQQPDLLDGLPQWVRFELSRLVPELAHDNPPSALVSKAEKIRLFDAFAEFNRAFQQDNVIVSDDVQYIDAATVEMLVYALGKFGSVGNADLKFTIEIYRKGELDPTLEQNVVQNLVAAGMAMLIDIEPLSGAAVGQLLETLEIEGMTTQMIRFTGGNPLFVLETVRHLQETGQLEGGWTGRLPPPSKVGSVIGQRLGKLSAHATSIIRVAAVLQSDFSPNLIAQVLEERPLDLLAAWQELESAQMLLGHAFAHDLIYETVRASLPPVVSTVLHARAAEVLTNANANPARIAQHWVQAGEPDKAQQVVAQ